MSSVVTWSVSSYPSTTIATESPTRITSTPAASAVRADGASYAVTITRGGVLTPSLLRAAMSGAVTRRVARAAIRPSSTVQGTLGSRRQTSAYPIPALTNQVDRGQNDSGDGPCVRELWVRRRGARARAAHLCRAGDVGASAVTHGRSRTGVVVCLLRVAIPLRAG